jgi:hypothetical protein
MCRFSLCAALLAALAWAQPAPSQQPVGPKVSIAFDDFVNAAKPKPKSDFASFLEAGKATDPAKAYDEVVHPKSKLPSQPQFSFKWDVQPGPYETSPTIYTGKLILKNQGQFREKGVVQLQGTGSVQIVGPAHFDVDLGPGEEKSLSFLFEFTAVGIPGDVLAKYQRR